MMLHGLARSDHSALTSLVLAEDRLEAEDAVYLASALRGQAWKTKAGLLDDDGRPRQLAAAEDHSPASTPPPRTVADRRPAPLTVLRLSQNKVGDRGCCAIAEVLLGYGKTLKELHLDDNRIGDLGAKALADALFDDKQLAVLGLGLNRIGPRGGSAIADALLENEAVVDVALNSNHVSSQGAVKFAELLAAHTNLSILDLRDNSLGVLGHRMLSRAIVDHPCLAMLKLQGNSIGNCTCKACICSRQEASLLQFSVELDGDGIEDELQDPARGLVNDGAENGADDFFTERSAGQPSDAGPPRASGSTGRGTRRSTRGPRPRNKFR